MRGMSIRLRGVSSMRIRTMCSVGIRTMCGMIVRARSMTDGCLSSFRAVCAVLNGCVHFSSMLGSSMCGVCFGGVLSGGTWRLCGMNACRVRLRSVR